MQAPINILLYLRGGEEGRVGDVLARRIDVVLVEGRQRCELLMCVSKEHMGPIINGGDGRRGRDVESGIRDLPQTCKCRGRRSVVSPIS